MTAEIAIMNRTAVALAADSIVTLAGSRGRKSYDSAEKLFQLSKHQPIGLMIYNNAQFMNAPLEVLARSYRATLTTSSFTRLEEVWPHFAAYLLHFDHTNADEDDHFRRMAASEIDQLRSIHFNYMVEAVGRKKIGKGETAEERVGRAVAERRSEAAARSIPGFLENHTLEAFVDRYGEVIDRVAEVALNGLNLNAGLRTAIHDLIFTIVRSDIRSELYTGFVIAGFGREDIFPTLHWIETDGVYFGEFRIVASGIRDIDRRGDTAAIVPFAQTDMVERFMFGIDSSSEETLVRMVCAIVGQILAGKPRTFPENTRAALLTAVDGRVREGLGQLKANAEQTLRAVVDHLSKKELGEVAYSLVELTSRKRRYSTEPETVGGPIDVAILSRNEGFIWVRRKHYFDAALNPQYAAPAK